jgi:hypothetical protein
MTRHDATRSSLSLKLVPNAPSRWHVSSRHSRVEPVLGRLGTGLQLSGLLTKDPVVGFWQSFVKAQLDAAGNRLVAIPPANCPAPSGRPNRHEATARPTRRPNRRVLKIVNVQNQAHSFTPARIASRRSAPSRVGPVEARRRLIVGFRPEWCLDPADRPSAHPADRRGLRERREPVDRQRDEVNATGPHEVDELPVGTCRIPTSIIETRLTDQLDDFEKRGVVGKAGCPADKFSRD